MKGENKEMRGDNITQGMSWRKGAEYRNGEKKNKITESKDQTSPGAMLHP